MLIVWTRVHSTTSYRLHKISKVAQYENCLVKRWGQNNIDKVQERLLEWWVYNNIAMTGWIIRRCHVPVRFTSFRDSSTVMILRFRIPWFKKTFQQSSRFLKNEVLSLPQCWWPIVNVIIPFWWLSKFIRYQILLVINLALLYLQVSGTDMLKLSPTHNVLKHRCSCF